MLRSKSCMLDMFDGCVIRGVGDGTECKCVTAAGSMDRERVGLTVEQSCRVKLWVVGDSIGEWVG